ncbi:HIRAN [Candidatus Propionivibrio aalborgensis]|uniref:HIRAN n=1 Tax=Candidatus Propionivibrio aalborgensis TaxID=1860101 RepID=A0A1A8XNN8_9RHOO|nr:HIRAN domain-containing protein [Candidatus Propionivibrio aalborgensis]MBK7324825.1 HIRAN domain-containing protein [Propionivibrio sp.]SBT06261.1 HIRAN [Candidatus Propionivibrio aalborgensis]
MRLPRTSLPIVGLLFAGLLIASLACAESIKILVQSSPLAGSQYYSAAKMWNKIKPGDRLTLTREPDNRHDRNAVRVDWNGHQLGYVPRAENRAVARALDAGEKLEAHVSVLRDDPDPWKRVEFEVYLIL